MGFGIRDSLLGTLLARRLNCCAKLGPQPSGSDPELLTLPIIIDTSSPLGAPRFNLHSFVGSPLFSYTAATVIMGVAVLILWTWKVSLREEVADSPRPAALALIAREAEPVGRITGMADCRWAAAVPHGKTIPLGGTFALASGLLEISY